MDNELKRLKKTAVQIRRDIIEATSHGKGGGIHVGPALSSVDLVTALYFKIMTVNPENPEWMQRDRFILSKGHAYAVWYSALAEKGFFPREELLTMRAINSRLQGHPNMNTVPGVDMSTGSLGQGISTAVGMAKGAKYLGKDVNVYCLLGDGEIAEGQVWEASLFAAHYKLDNFCAIVDVNGLQIDGRTADVMNTAPLSDKFAAFGYDVTEIDGHDFTQLEAAFAKFHANAGTGKPTMILLATTKGKGVSYMEGQCGWHGKAPDDALFAQAKQELEATLRQLEGK